MNLVLLKSLYEQDKANQIKVLLDKYEITSKINYSRNNLEVTLGQQTSNVIEIYVFENELDKATEVIQHILEEEEIELDINDYSSEELQEIILNKDDWHDTFVDQAKVILENRGIVTPEEDVQKNLEEKVQKVKQGVSVSKLNIAFLWTFSFFGFFLALAAGYFLWQGKTRASNGQKYYLYDSKARNHGKWMLILGFVTTTISIILVLIM